MSSPHGAPDLPYCRNCHYTLATPRPRHCGHCGQETDLHPPSVREMVTEYLGHYVALDGPLWRTLWALIALPGHLTNAYFHGQRRRYVLPLRVYLSASFVFFLGWALLPAGPSQVIETQTAQVQPGAPVTVQVQPGMTPAQAAAAADAIARGASAPASAGDGGQREYDVARVVRLARGLQLQRDGREARQRAQHRQHQHHRHALVELAGARLNILGRGPAEHHPQRQWQVDPDHEVPADQQTGLQARHARPGGGQRAAHEDGRQQARAQAQLVPKGHAGQLGIMG